MSKLRDRAEQRGKCLDKDCKNAHTVTHEFGEEDSRVFCYGLADPSADCALDKCRACGAWVANAKPLPLDETEFTISAEKVTVTLMELNKALRCCLLGSMCTQCPLHGIINCQKVLDSLLDEAIASLESLVYPPLSQQRIAERSV